MANKLFLTIILFTIIMANGQDYQLPTKIMESFEEGIPDGLFATGRSLVLDTRRMKQGKQSLKWQWQGNDVLRFNTPIGYRKQRVLDTSDPEVQKSYPDLHGGSNTTRVLEPPHGFFMWIYNDQARAQRLRIQFGRGDEVDCEFDYNINFKGWRTLAINYDRGDMRGIPREDMNRMTINAPATGSGTFYLDVLGFSVPMNPRTVNANPQLPEIDRHPRLVAQYPHLLYEWSKQRPTFNLESLTDADIQGFRSLEAKAMDLWLPPYDKAKWSESKLKGIVERYESYEIVREGDNIYGRPVSNARTMTEYFAESEIPSKKRMEGIKRWREDFGVLLLDMARAYHCTDSSTNKAKLAKMFIDLFDHGVEQGFDVGAGLGWIHHYSYIIREHVPAMFLMRDVLKEQGRLDKAITVCKWFYSFNQVYNEDVVYDCPGRTGINADESQGLLKQRLLCALMMEDSAEKARDLRHFSSYYSNIASAYANALDETFKPDGTMFHHAGHAFGYGGRAVYGAVETLYLLSHSPYQAADVSYQRMRKVVEALMFSLFTDKLLAPKAFANIRFSNYDLPTQFYNAPAMMALASDPFDEDMAALYRDLLGKKSSQGDSDKLWLSRVQAKTQSTDVYNYTGFKLFPYTCVALKRQQDDWMISVRGFSKYVYPYESWGTSYFAFPLYIGNGYLDVSYPDSLDSVTPDQDVWYPGYDWHRWPGVTSVYLPYEKMLTSPGQVRDEGGEYIFSDQAFSGGVQTTYGCGIYVFPFKGHDKFGIQSFTGKKTYLFFDDKVLCLGTDIQSGLTDYVVETTLFQSYLSNADQPITVGSMGEVNAFPYELKTDVKQPLWMIDTRRTGFYVPALDPGDELIVSRNNQTHPDQNNKDILSSNFASAWINHGKAPTGASYQYLLIADTNGDKMTRFAQAMQKRKPPVDVLQMDAQAHVVALNDIKATAYAVYEEDGQAFAKGPVKSVSKQATFMVKEEGDKLRLSVADPDLNIYDGQDDLLPDGTRCELSIYEREWFYWPSRPTMVEITLRGQWAIDQQVREMETANNKNAQVISTENNQTVIEFECRDGLSAEVLLRRGNTP